MSVQEVAGIQTTVYIAEDHPVFQDAVARALRARPEFELVGTANDGRVALEEIRRTSPSVALLDQSLPGLAGIDVARAIVRDALATRVVMLSADGSSGIVYDAIRLGVAGFLTKAATLEQICNTVAAVARGETVLAQEIQSGLVSALRERERAEQPLLSPREAQVLALIAQGLSGPEIGSRLFISSSTVKSHVKSVLEKLGVSDRAAAVAEGMRRGLIE
jgi:two-component system, NarL family, nitrate/nitrite response regulator NarL